VRNGKAILFSEMIGSILIDIVNTKSKLLGTSLIIIVYTNSKLQPTSVDA